MTDAAPIHDATELTRHIEIRYHARHREQLAKMAEMVEDLHAGDEGAPDGLSDLLRRMMGDIEVHMKKEELVLFPAIRRGGAPEMGNRIAAMRADHADHEAEVTEIRRLTDNLILPGLACSS